MQGRVKCLLYSKGVLYLVECAVGHMLGVVGSIAVPSVASAVVVFALLAWRDFL